MHISFKNCNVDISMIHKIRCEKISFNVKIQMCLSNISDLMKKIRPKIFNINIKDVYSTVVHHWSVVKWKIIYKKQLRWLIRLLIRRFNNQQVRRVQAVLVSAGMYFVSHMSADQICRGVQSTVMKSALFNCYWHWNTWDMLDYTLENHFLNISTRILGWTFHFTIISHHGE